MSVPQNPPDCFALPMSCKKLSDLGPQIYRHRPKLCLFTSRQEEAPLAATARTMVPLLRSNQMRRPMGPHSPRHSPRRIRYVFQGLSSPNGTPANPDEDAKNADDLVALGFLFCKSRVLHAAIDMDLFSKLAQNGGSLSFSQLQDLLGLHLRAKDFLDALVSLQLLNRDDDTDDSLYSNSEATQVFLVRGSDTFIGDLLENCSNLYESFINVQDPNCKMVNVGSLMERIMSAAKLRTARSIYEGSMNTSNDDMSSVSGFGDDTVVSTESNDLTFDFIVQLAFGFAPSRMLHLAVELGVFALLAGSDAGKMSAKDMKKLLGTDEARIKECLRTLVGFKVLGMNMERGELVFYNTPIAAKYLDPSLPTYIGGVFRMCGAYEFRNWNNLTTSLKTGEPASDSCPEPSKRLCYMTFLSSQSCMHAAAFESLAKQFDFSAYKSLVDCGGATGQLACAVAQENKRMRCITANEASAAPLAEQQIRTCGMEGRVVSVKHEQILDALPRADVLALSFVMEILKHDDKKALLSKSYDALSKGGALLVIGKAIDGGRRVDTTALCASLNLLLEQGGAGGSNYTATELQELCREAGFSRFGELSLGSCSAVIAYK